MGYEILGYVTWSSPRPLRGQLVIWRSVLLVAKQCTNFEVCSFSRSEDISWGVKL